LSVNEEIVRDLKACAPEDAPAIKRAVDLLNELCRHAVPANLLGGGCQSSKIIRRDGPAREKLDASEIGVVLRRSAQPRRNHSAEGADRPHVAFQNETRRPIRIVDEA